MPETQTKAQPSHKPSSSKRRLSKTTIAGLILLTLSIISATLPFILMVVNSGMSTRAVDAHESDVDKLSVAKANEAFAQAKEYNARLFQEGSQVLGEVSDPWSGGKDSLAQEDKTYQKMLNVPADGIMATIRYPRLGINLPIRHGTSDVTLASGAGHLYGTSLPVGGTNTHSVISAHTGYDRLMFDRLSMGQGRIGDFFYITVLGHVLAYRVSSIFVIEPDDFSHFAIEAGKDQVTLLTCTPYGVNNKRMLVTGQRVKIPNPAPDPKTVPQDHPEYWLIAGVVLVWLLFMLFVFLIVTKRRKKKLPARSLPAHHAAGVKNSAHSITSSESMREGNSVNSPSSTSPANERRLQ